MAAEGGQAISMAAYKQECQQGKRVKRPLDATQLRDMALSYVARYATSAGKLERYLVRKLRERGWAEGDELPDIAALISGFVELGYIDDAAFARTRGSSLQRRGYGARRVHQTLAEAGVDKALRDDVTRDMGDRRRAALVMARKRRFGPFGLPAADRAAREKQLSAMLRAGHDLDMAREMVNAASIAAAEAWAAELDGEAGDGAG
ncbi:MAG: RecX family transcriptional regulator [Alteraurantiacibacter sp.]